jgi:hypothetical protein
MPTLTESLPRTIGRRASDIRMAAVIAELAAIANLAGLDPISGEPMRKESAAQPADSSASLSRSREQAASADPAPETNAVWGSWLRGNSDAAAVANVARGLQRERNAARAEVAHLRALVTRLEFACVKGSAP